MSTEQPQQTQSKSPNGQSEGQQPPSQAQAALAPTLAPYPPPPFNGHYPPPPGAYPGPFYTYAPVDGSHDPNGQGGMPSGPFLVAAYPPPPPGMMYAFSPPGHMGYPPFPPGMQPGSMPRPKRKQVKMACTNCAGACKRCDEARPCERCIKYGIADSCIDGVRKERKKGVKRGPYKRKSKNSGDNANGTGSQSGENGEAPSASTQPVYSPVPSEYSYPAPYYMPQPYGFPPPPPPPHEGHSSPNGSTSNDGHPPSNGHPQVIPHPMFPLHPAVYPTYPPYPYPGMMQAPPQAPQQDKDGEEGTGKGKKRGRPSKGDDSAKEKRSKQPVAAAPPSASAGPTAAVEAGAPAVAVEGEQYAE